MREQCQRARYGEEIKLSMSARPRREILIPVIAAVAHERRRALARNGRRTFGRSRRRRSKRNPPASANFLGALLLFLTRAYKCSAPPPHSQPTRIYAHACQRRRSLLRILYGAMMMARETTYSQATSCAYRGVWLVYGVMLLVKCAIIIISYNAHIVVVVVMTIM